MFGLDLAVDLLDLLILVDIWVLMLFISCLIWASIEALVFSGGSMYGMLTFSVHGKEQRNRFPAHNKSCTAIRTVQMNHDQTP